MKFLGGGAGGGGGELRTERAQSPCSLQPHDEGGGESIRKGRSGPAPDDTAAVAAHAAEGLVNGDEPMSANHGDPEAEIPFADEDEDGEGVEASVAPSEVREAEEQQDGVPEEEEEESHRKPSTDIQGQVRDGRRENGEEEESSSPTSSSDEDSQRRPAPGGTETETELEEEEPVAARSIVRCKSSSRSRRRRGRSEEPPLGILKGTSGRVSRRRVTFNEMMTVFMDGCPEVQVPAFRPWDLTFSEVCYMYEPPPEYRDWEGAFEPPDGYRDLDGVTTFDEASGSSDDDRGPVPPVRSQDTETLFPMEDEDLSSGEFVVHRVTIAETEPEMVQLNDSSDQEDELVDEPETPVEESVPRLSEGDAPPEIETDLDEETTLEGEDPLAESEVEEEVREGPRGEEESTVTTPEELESCSEPLSNISEQDCTAEVHDEADDEGDKTTEEEEEISTKVSRTNSQIRRSLELSALRRSLLRGETELVAARRRRQVVSRPKSPSSSGIEEKLRWLTSTEDLTTTGAPMSPPRGPAAAVPNGPTRWTSEQIYPPPYGSHQCGPPPYPNLGHPQQAQQQQHQQQQQQQQLPYYRPPSRPSSFDPHVGLIAWEGYLQQRDRTRAAYQRHVERHPNAADRPPPTSQPPRRPSNNSDELEWFVQRDSERTERIKKRYSLSEDEDPTFGFGRRPSVRGIRPRFGSTTEILQQLQSQLHKRPPPPPNCLLQYSSLPRIVSGTPGGPFLPYPDLVARLPKVREEYAKRRPGEPVSIVRPDGRSPDPSAGSNQKGFINKDERGAPEGASSSPKMSTDSLFTGGKPGSQPPKEDVVVYYSLRV